MSRDADPALDAMTREQILRARGGAALSNEDPPAAAPPAPSGRTCLECSDPLPPRATKFCSKLCGRRHYARSHRGPEHPVPVSTVTGSPEQLAPPPKGEGGEGAGPDRVVTLVAKLIDGTIVDSVEIHLDGARLVVRSASR